MPSASLAWAPKRNGLPATGCMPGLMKATVGAWSASTRTVAPDVCVSPSESVTRRSTPAIVGPG